MVVAALTCHALPQLAPTLSWPRLTISTPVGLCTRQQIVQCRQLIDQYRYGADHFFLLAQKEMVRAQKEMVPVPRRKKWVWLKMAHFKVPLSRI